MKQVMVAIIGGMLLAGCVSTIQVTDPRQLEEINARGAEFPALITMRANGGDAEYRGDGLTLAGDSAHWYDDGAQAWVGVPLSQVHRIRFAKRRTSSGALVGGRSDFLFNAPEPSRRDTVQFHANIDARLEHDGRLLEYASEASRDEARIVLPALKQDGLLLRFASPRLQQQREAVLTALLQNGLALLHAAPSFRDSVLFVSTAVNNNGLALRYASGRLQDRADVVITAVSQNGLALKFASRRLRADSTIVRRAMANNPAARYFAVDVSPAERATMTGEERYAAERAAMALIASGEQASERGAASPSLQGTQSMQGTETPPPSPAPAVESPIQKPMLVIGYSRGSASSGLEVALPHLYLHCSIGSMNSISSSAYGLGGYVQLGRFSLYSGLERFVIDYEPSYAYWGSYYRGRSSSASEGIQWYLGSTYSIPFGKGAVPGGMYVGLSVGSGRGFATGIGLYF